MLYDIIKSFPGSQDGRFTETFEAGTQRELSDYLAAHKAAAASLQDAVLDTNLPDLLTAAISDFCCFGIVDRTPFRDQDANAWTSGWRVMLHSCPSAIA